MIEGSCHCPVCDQHTEFRAVAIESSLFIPCRNKCGGTTIELAVIETSLGSQLAVVAVEYETEIEILAAARQPAPHQRASLL